MAESLKQKTVKGLIWSGFERFLGQIITFVLALVLARLVTPADYGILAIVMVFVTISGVMVDAGFANALIRKVDCTDVDRSTVLYFNVVVSILIYAILYFLSPVISSFYDNDQLTILLRCASVIIIINSLGIVQQATLTSRVDFKRQTAVSLVSSITSGLVGIYLAYSGFGVWALIVQAILYALIRVVMLWIIVRWRPLLIFSRESFKDLFGYSYKLMLSNLIVHGGKDIIQLLLGKFFSVATLGQYNYANRMGNFLPLNISTSIQRVLFPVFSKIQDNDEALAENFRKSLVLSMTLIVPIMFSISALAEPIIKLLLTDEWLPTIPILRVIAITMSIWPLLLFNMNILWVKKRSDLSLKLEVINIVFRLGLVLALCRTGILWVCIALCAAELLNFVVYAHTVGKVCIYGLGKQVKDLWFIYMSSAISGLVVYSYVITELKNILITGCIGVISFSLIYFFFLKLRNGYEINTIYQMIKIKRNK